MMLATTLAATLVLLVATNAHSWAAAGSGALYGARDPATCKPLRQATPPDPDQAAALVRCRTEKEHTYELWLMKDLRIEIGRGRRYGVNDTNVTDPDLNFPIYPLRGSFVWSICNTRSSVASFGQDPNLNCRELNVPQATGSCWRTNFDDWACTLGGSTVGEARLKQPPLR